MKRSTVSVVLALIAVIALVSIAHGQPREEIRLTTIIPDQSILRVKKGIVSETNYKPSKFPNDSIPDRSLIVEGSVGIGMKNPQAKLDINGSLSDYLIRIDSPRPTIILSRDGTNRWDIGVMGASESAGDKLFFGDTVSKYWMVMDRGTGNVGIGTTNPGAKLEVYKDDPDIASDSLAFPSGNWSAKIFNTDDIASEGGLVVANRYQDVQSTAFLVGGLYNGGTGFDNFLRVDGLGNVIGKYGSWVSSDIRLKKDIVTIPNALEKVLALRGVNFWWKNPSQGDSNLHMGMIAQEVEKVTPEVVRTADDTMKTKSVDYQYMVGLLVEAMKELKAEKDAEVKQLKAEIAALRTRGLTE